MKIQVKLIFVLLSLIKLVSMEESCSSCSGSRDKNSIKKEVEREDVNEINKAPKDTDLHTEMVPIPGGAFTMGTDLPIFVADGEAPARRVKISPFLMDVHEVTNAAFKAFVDDTNFVTETEKFGDSFVMENYISDETKATITVSFSKDLI